MASGVRVNIDANRFRQFVNNSPEVKSEVNKAAGKISAKANGMSTEKSGIWHEIGKPYTPGKEGGEWHGTHKEIKYMVGGTDAVYGSKPAKPTGDGTPVAIVFTANNAAQKDNMKNNTLLKAMG